MAHSMYQSRNSTAHFFRRLKSSGVRVGGPSDDGGRCGARLGARCQPGELLGPRRRSCVEGFEPSVEPSIEPGVAGGDDIFLVS
ncbi:unnamed protein product [Adineta steineri]|uniref:Uncharacterized protein n=2 Tax=Adineta steineri TaxID=433720 RepID=A0A815AEB1_9BILA|nr:unnamed protein product [Adineta steineri]